MAAQTKAKTSSPEPSTHARAGRTRVSTKPSPTEGKGAQTRRAILDAAIARFARDGFRATSVADIARDAGVGGTITYAYFPNKEALFLAALDEDAAGVIEEAVPLTEVGPTDRHWNESLLLTLVEAVERHPLARRVLAGLEPHATMRMAEIPALRELRKGIADRLRADQLAGVVRDDIDPVATANGLVAISLSLLMAVLQFGSDEAASYASDVVAVLEAALIAPQP
ncbi:MAG: TetR/AcrR family transcriptional regulator [Acidimicrobiales bacterium]|nr:TetR/AcrR family transcriptional regulator [Acidimicrobiales bacterium]